MQLLPEGTLRRKVFESVDRFLGNLFFGDPRTVSTHLGNRLKDGSATKFQYDLAMFIDIITMEKNHCLKNAGKQ